MQAEPFVVARLAPFAAADYDLDALQRRGAIPPEVREVLLEAESFAAPGSVMGRAFSVSTDLSYGLYSVLESDGTGFWSGIYWSLKGDENTVMTIANIGDEETTAAVELAYPGGVARLRPFPVRSRETVTLNLRRDLPRMLAEGARLPPGAESGGYRVRSVEDPLRAQLVVKQHVLSASKRTAAPFYGQCNYVTSIWLSTNTWPVQVELGGTADVSPMCNWNVGGSSGDYGANVQPDGGNEISISPQYGYTRTVSGLNLGTRDILLNSSVPTQNNPCGYENMMGQATPSAVRCFVGIKKITYLGNTPGGARKVEIEVTNGSCVDTVTVALAPTSGYSGPFNYNGGNPKVITLSGPGQTSSEVVEIDNAGSGSGNTVFQGAIVSCGAGNPGCTNVVFTTPHPVNSSPVPFD